ncbi:hypothetical protein FO488_07690 [Geobacter sp. FeAm09]|uniref:sensor histidine kinase n=1 Tax=Geobacter sp. FeAm09 TaxID=2597769 RepID=UPI0011EBC054|nr:ATP-binding protein [Geobacter sp. FeAm09]QEM68053.1 hypothetical protein FO488_07690 [Geobacter sp. FeAm09]
MKAFSGWSIRTHLILLVALAVTPALAIILYTGLEQKRNSMNEAYSQCSALVKALAGDMTNTVSSTRQLLTTLAVLPQVRHLDVPACNGLFREILRSDDRYLNLQLFRPTGESAASVIPPPPGLNVSDRKYFRDAVRRRAFSAGEFIVGRTVNRPTFNFALPVTGDRGELLGVVQAAVNLERVNAIFDKSHFPAGSALVLLDGTGTILYGTDARHRIGTKDDRGIFNDMLAARGNERITLRPSGGAYRIMAYRSLQLAGDSAPYLHIRLEVPEEAILTDANRILIRNLWFLTCAVALAAMAAFAYANRVIINRARRLVRSSGLLAAGGQDVLVGIPYTEGEFGLIARAFDDMAKTLALREEERATFVRDLQAATGRALDERAKTEAILASIGDGISIQDREYRILYQNDTSKGWMDDQTGRFCYEAYERQQEVCDNCPVRQTFEDGQVHTVERNLTINGRDTCLLITASPLRNSAGDIIGGIEIVKDITGRKQVEIAQQELTNKLAESNQQLQHFAYIASHDLQEPLRTITSFIQLLARRYQGTLDKDAGEFIAFITDGAQRMQRLINDLLEYSRVESQGAPFVVFEAGNALRAAEMNLKKRIGESGAEITHDPLPAITGDETQIMQLFQNLLGNAIKFRGSEPPRIHVACAETPVAWEFRVTDNGIGIDGQFFDRIFEIFQRLHGRDAYPGTGIGLAICRKIVERHGGRIGVASEAGRGSCFTFTIKKDLTEKGDAA